MKHRGLQYLCASACVLLLSAPPVLAQTRDDKSEKMKQRLEQLFVWRVSDRLSLSPAQEQEFSLQFHRISEERSKLSVEMDGLLDQMEKEKDNASKVNKLFGDYESAMKKYNALQIKEIDDMKHIFDNKKLAEYVLLKREMTQKFKDVLTQSTVSSSKSVEKTNLKEPQVIQEK